jgi:hypothetical protein
MLLTVRLAVQGVSGKPWQLCGVTVIRALQLLVMFCCHSAAEGLLVQCFHGDVSMVAVKCHGIVVVA